ncbi:MAG: hypothetical protein NE330_10230, partial [Lentisphaeraceae bacterium]|nr:hypothetical protein [Lentisphaeraceae bacterium]
EKVAEESGLKRPLIRHFVGNREDLLILLEKQVTSHSRYLLDELVANLNPIHKSQDLIEVLFNEDSSSSYEELSVITALIMESANNPELQMKMKAWFVYFEECLKNCLRSDYPEALDDQLNMVSFGIISSYFNIDSLKTLALESSYRADALAVAKALLKVLEV